MKRFILIAGLLLCSTWSFAQHSNFLEGKRFYEKTDRGKEYFNFKYGGDFVLESPEVTIGFTNRGIKYTPTGKTNTTNGKYEYDDSRRPRLTLTHLNKLKKMRKLKKLDLDKRYKFFKKFS